VRYPELAWIADEPGGPAWLEALPRLVTESARRFGVSTGEPFAGGVTAAVLAASRADGTPAVLKVGWPHRESEHEAAALALLDGDGAVRLYASDAERHALLVERCLPGTPLASRPASQALAVLAGLLPRLWKPAGAPFRSAADEAAWWAADLEARYERAGRPFERRLLDAALAALRELPPTQGPSVLVHQDLHAGNVLRARREPWLAIDPKPLAGERELALAPIVRGTELGHGPRSVRDRLDRLCGELGLDRERARGWTIGQTIAWCFDGGDVIREHVEAARWLLEPRPTAPYGRSARRPRG
jgi:streptomycin 6-kinase